MANNVYRLTEIVGTSSESMEDAIRTAIKTASGTLHNLEWFEVKEIRGAVKDGDVDTFQVTVNLGFRYER